ncbi:MAG: NFACT family protein [Roseburia sp.]|nr:NFACT family protein [Roseburia sp.]
MVKYPREEQKLPKDALTIYRAACELDALVGGIVDKVTMPDRDTVILAVHTKSGNRRLLLSCNPSLPRVHLTTRRYANPETASGTLMYFRKRLTGAVIEGIEKDRCERMITFVFSALDELKERVGYRLAAELTGKCANIIFVEKNGVIGNCLRRVTAEVEGKRAVLIGLDYAPPNATGRIGVFDGDALKAKIRECGEMSARAAVNKCVAGLASATVDELFFKLGTGDAPPTDDVLDGFIAAAQDLYGIAVSPTAVFGDDGKPLDYTVVPYATLGGRAVGFPTVNEAMDEYYSALFTAADMAAYRKPLKNAVKTAVNKNKKRLAEACAKLEESASAEIDRQLGELITANIYRIKRGDARVTADNYFDADMSPITIELDTTKNAQQNAAAYFKAYSKKKKAAVYAEAAADAARSALDRLDGISLELELCTDKRELDEVRAELVALGLMRPEQKKRKAKQETSEPYVFDVYGAQLLVGKNSAQNERITRGAAKTDTWLHVKDAHGCHAVLKTSAPTEKQLERAAEIAAYYSQSRASENVAVDHTLIKHVFPHGGGKAEYKEYKTLFVTPKA